MFLFCLAETFKKMTANFTSATTNHSLCQYYITKKKQRKKVRSSQDNVYAIKKNVRAKERQSQ